MTKEQELCRALEIAWDSLQSHMEWTYKASSEGKAFHKRCIADYSELMYLIGKQLL